MPQNQTQQLGAEKLSAEQLPDPRPWYARSREQMAGLVALVGPEHLDDPTPCTEFAVRTLLAHIVGACNKWAALGEGGDELVLRPTVSGVPDDGWIAAYDEASGWVAKAWAGDDRMEAVITVPWGAAQGRFALPGFVLETVTHSWDLARALGGDTTDRLDDELAEYALEFARNALPVDRRGEQVPFGQVREVADDATAYDRLAGWLGREPGWTA